MGCTPVPVPQGYKGYIVKLPDRPSRFWRLVCRLIGHDKTEDYTAWFQKTRYCRRCGTICPHCDGTGEI